MKSTGIKVRPLGLDDLREIFILGKELFQGKDLCSFREWNEKVLAEILADNLEISFIAVRKKRAAGFLIGALAERGESGRQAEILWLGVRRDEDRAVGHDLIEAFTSRCEEVHGDKILVRIAGSELKLIDMYRKCGFTPSGEELIMERVYSSDPQRGRV